MNSQSKLLLLTALFVICLGAANILSAAKLISIFGFTVDAGIIAYPLTFLFTDIVCEVWGKRTATRVVWVGFFANMLMMLLIWIGGILPPSPQWGNQEAYQSVLGSVPRIVFASMVAYLISQHHDVFAFQFWRRKTRGRWLWMRNNFSTIVSQGLDTVVFGTIAFYGVVPLDVLVGEIILVQYIIKIAVALLDTPFCYLLVGWARGFGAPSVNLEA
ncbi:MAG: queuosine precursor transporter [Dehalococcoidia bacterium]|nr:Inner membrane protein YhhQ [Chloroflexota bacterium]MBT9161804.1 Inner membrane protein YhhQ [Chloroflexota bacterium]